MRGRRTSRRKRWGASGAVIASLIVLAGGPGAASAFGDEAAWVFNPDAVVEIELGGLSPEELDALEAEPDEYQRGTFELKVGGVAQGPPLGEVGIRLKGTGSFRGLNRKAAFKLKFNEYSEQAFFGLKKLTLNNMVQDPSMLHETLAYELFRALGVPASRTGFADVSVNGIGYGVYLSLETLDKVSLPLRFASTRHLYEADEPGLDVSPGSAGAFEADEGKGSKREDLEALIVAANGTTGDWSDGMAAAADLTEMTRMWAVERYIGHWDGYAGVVEAFRPNNYYLHDEDAGPTAGVFQMLPWGTDQTWGARIEFSEPAGGLMFNRCLADQSCKELYVGALRELQNVAPGLGLDARASTLASQLAPWQALETDPRREFSVPQVEAGVVQTRAFIGSRPAELAEWLDGGEKQVADGVDAPQSAGLSAGATGPTATKIRVKSELTAGRVLRNSLRLPVAGKISQEVTIETSRGPLRACATHARVEKPGTLTLRCRLSAMVRRHLRERWLKLHMAIRFKPEDGKAEVIERELTVPRLRPASPRISAARYLPVPGGFELRGSNGYTVSVLGLSSEGGGRGSVLLYVRGRAGAVNYFAPAAVTRTSIQAHLGELGEIDAHFRRSGGARRERSACGGKPVTFDSGFYEGTIDFTGEEGYTEVHTARVRGDLGFVLNLTCSANAEPAGTGPGLPGAALRVVHRSSGVGASLDAHKNRPGARAVFEAAVTEERDGVGIERFTGARAPSAAFDYDPLLQVATVEPPPPFTGRATFHRHAAPVNRWTGDLAVDFPGRAGVSLTVGSPSVKLIHAVWRNRGRPGENAANAP